MTRCERKRTAQYSSWSDFLYRKQDSIWEQERWICPLYLMPCVGLELRWDPLIAKRLEHMMGERMICIGALEKRVWEIGCIRAPSDMTFCFEKSKGIYTVYSLNRNNIYCIIEGHFDTAPPFFLERGQQIGHIRAQGKIYLISLRERD